MQDGEELPAEDETRESTGDAEQATEGEPSEPPPKRTAAPGWDEPSAVLKTHVAGKPQQPWQVELHELGLSFRGEGQDENVSRDDLSAMKLQATTNMFLLRIKLAVGKRLLVLERNDAVTLARWLGPSAGAKALTSPWFLIFLGILYTVGSLPMDADPVLGIPASPLDPFGLALGLSALLVGVLGKLRPHRFLVLVDTIWIGALALMLGWDVYRGSSMWWLALAALLGLAVVGHYRLFGVLQEAAKTDS